jgi:hypothetical protein
MTAGVVCRFTVHFSTSFSTISVRLRSHTKVARERRTNQALAGSNPASGDIFGATSTSNNVAVLRTLPEVVMSCL